MQTAKNEPISVSRWSVQTSEQYHAKSMLYVLVLNFFKWIYLYVLINKNYMFIVNPNKYIQ